MTIKAVRNLRALSLNAFWNCVTNKLQNPRSRLPDAAGDSDGEFGPLMLGGKCAPGSCAAEQFRQIIPRINLRMSHCCAHIGTATQWYEGKPPAGHCAAALLPRMFRSPAYP